MLAGLCQPGRNHRLDLCGTQLMFPGNLQASAISSGRQQQQALITRMGEKNKLTSLPLCGRSSIRIELMVGELVLSAQRNQRPGTKSAKIKKRN